MLSVKERAASYGVNSLSNMEAISLLVGADVSKFKNVKTIQDVFDGYESMSLTDLQKRKVEALFSCQERYVDERLSRKKISSPGDVASLMIPKMKGLKREEFRVLLLNTKNYIIEEVTVSIGSLSSSIVHPREVFKRAIEVSAASMLLFHNHPSNISNPSKEDLVVTNRLKDAGDLMGIKVVDHIIIAGNDYYSFKEHDQI